jgi:hypothetical protein
MRIIHREPKKSLLERLHKLRRHGATYDWPRRKICKYGAYQPGDFSYCADLSWATASIDNVYFKNKVTYSNGSICK